MLLLGAGLLDNGTGGGLKASASDAPIEYTSQTIKQVFLFTKDIPWQSRVSMVDLVTMSERAATSVKQASMEWAALPSSFNIHSFELYI